MIRLKATLERLQAIQCEGDKEEEGAKVKMVKAAIREFITKSYQSGNTQEHVEQSMQDLHKMFFIHDPAIHQWAQERAAETYSQSLPMSHSPMGAGEAQAQPSVSDETHPLFSKDTVYHASICSLAVNDVKECDPGNYQKFFQKNPMIRGHDFQEVSISRSKKDRYLIARQGESTIYIAFQSEPSIQQWPNLFRSFSEGRSGVVGVFIWQLCTTFILQG